MQSVKVIHLLKRVEEIDRDIRELKSLVEGIDSSRSYRNMLKIAAEQQINNLIGEKVKLMELKIENPPDFLLKHVYPDQQEAKPAQPRISLEALQNMSSTYSGSAFTMEEMPIGERNPLRSYAKMMSVNEILPKEPSDTQTRQRRAEKTPVKTRAEILRDLPPLQY